MNKLYKGFELFLKVVFFYCVIMAFQLILLTPILVLIIIAYLFPEKSALMSEALKYYVWYLFIAAVLYNVYVWRKAIRKIKIKKIMRELK